MATTRRPPPLHIFQDPVHPSKHPELQGSIRSEVAALNALGPARNELRQGRNAASDAAALASPVKSAVFDGPAVSRIFAESSANAVRLSPPNQEIGGNASPKKSLRPISQRFPLSKPQTALFNTFPSIRSSLDKENAPLGITAYSDSAVAYSAPPPPPPAFKVPSLKRRYSEAKEASNKKARIEDDGGTFELPEPERMPPVHDDGAKPQYSYATLIGMAILRAPNRRLTLSQIYKWISDTFKYYRLADAGWQNSIRHNLSLNKAFVKQERPKDDPGKGNYWAIESGYEQQFIKDKSKSRPPQASRVMLMDDLKPKSKRSSSRPSSPPPPMQPNPSKVDSCKFPEEPELSSDATIPASDDNCPDEPFVGVSMPPPPAPQINKSSSSPLAADIRSSPPAPLPRLQRQCHGTPSKAHRFAPASGSGGRRRRFAYLGDSGYFSSIESSATKAPFLGAFLASDVDLEGPRLKRGRAEEEIARIRGTAFDSPSQSRPFGRHSARSNLASSSPFRPFEDDGRLPKGPFTPPVIFKRPAKPPASVSPNTNLQNHRDRIRELLGSPDKCLSVLREETGWSPAFQLQPEDNNAFGMGDSGFGTGSDFLADMAAGFDLSTFAARGSPAKRPCLSRAASTSNVLAAMTGAANEKRLCPSSTPMLRPPVLHSPLRLESPKKRLPGVLKSVPANGRPNSLPDQLPPAGAEVEELFGVELPSDGSEEGFDILQGFRRIGAPPQAGVCPSVGSPRKGAKPALGRSITNLF